MGKLKLDKADTLFSLWIRTRDEWRCKRCFKQYQPPTRALHASHFQGRGKENTRFEPLNVDSLCYGCHRYFTSHPGEHYDWQVGKKGQDMVDRLILASNQYKKKDRLAERLYWRQKLKDDFDIKA